MGGRAVADTNLAHERYRANGGRRIQGALRGEAHGADGSSWLDVGDDIHVGSAKPAAIRQVGRNLVEVPGHLFAVPRDHRTLARRGEVHGVFEVGAATTLRRREDD